MEKLTCDFCQRDIETRRIPSERFGVVVYRESNSSKLVSKDACHDCADKLRQILGLLDQGMIDELRDRLTVR